MSHVDLGFFYYAFGIVALIAGSYIVIRRKTNEEVAKNQKQTEESYKDLAEAQGKKIKYLEGEVAKIPELQRQINDLKTIPLKDIAGSFKDISKAQADMVHTQKDIITLLTERPK